MLRGVARRPLTALAGVGSAIVARGTPARFAAAGFVAGALAVAGGGQVRPNKGATPPSAWLGVQNRGHTSAPWAGVAQILGILALVVVWLLLMRAAHAQGWSLRRLWTVAAAWAAPFLVGPPLLSGDVYSYAAQGLLIKSGGNPYSQTVVTLGLENPAVQMVDPVWRNVVSPYGPLASLLEHLAALVGRGPTGTVIAMRVLAAVSVVAIGLLAVHLAWPERRRWALLLTVLNPLVLLQLVSAAHLEAAMGALILAALVAARHGRMDLAIALGCAAGAIKVPGMLVVLAVVASMWHPTERTSNVLLGRAVAIVGGSWVVLTMLVPNGWGWVNGLSTPGLARTPAAPSSVIASLLGPIVPVASYDDLAAGGRAAATGLGICLVLYLLATARHRPVAVTTGFALFAMTLFGPVVYPWYLCWGLLVLAAVADARMRNWLLAVSVIGATAIVQGTPVAVAVTIVMTIDAIVLVWLLRTEVAARWPSRFAPATSAAIP